MPLFPETKTLEEVCTEDNLRKLITSYCDKDQYPTYKIDVVDGRWIEVIIYAKGQDSENAQKIYVLSLSNV